MLTEEAHHLFVGESGIGRILQRTAEVMKQLGTDDPVRIREAGAIDLPTIQKYLNFHFSVTLDLYGSEISTNAANFYTEGLKGRFEETKIEDDHKLGEDSYAVPDLNGETIVMRDVPALTALNERLRDDYIVDCEKGVQRWNAILKRSGTDFRLALPYKGFHRRIGTFAEATFGEQQVSPDGRVISEAEWTHHSTDWLPSKNDHAFVQSLMQPVTEPGKMASWIAPPARGIDNKENDFEYVRIH
jgi:benzoyl-CoA 2,3-dioxygenase component B